MNVSIQNQRLTLTIDTLGAQMMELRSVKGTEYLWNGDPVYWKGRAPVLFPFIGRLTNNSYMFQGTVYPMGIHGFASKSEFTLVEKEDNKARFELRSSIETEKIYPFQFRFSVIYILEDNCVKIKYEVCNDGEGTLPFAVGGHPGFSVPFIPGTSFNDYRIEFTTPCLPDRIGFSKDVYLNGVDEQYPLEDGKILRLSHDLFDDDAIILSNMTRSVRLCTDKGPESIRVDFPDMPYLGLWHMPHTDANYICIEPWTSLPARQNVVEEFSCKSDMIMLKQNSVYENVWSITIED